MRSLTIGALALGASMLTACGGGGGGGGGNKTPAQTTPQATLSLSTQSITASASYWDSAPTRLLALTLANPPPEGVYATYSIVGSGIAGLDLQPVNASAANLVVQFETPSLLAGGSHTGSIQLSLCYDENCSRHVRNSPATIATTYTVAPANSSVTSSSSTASVSASRLQSSQPTSSVDLTITNPGPVAPYVSVSYGSTPYIVQSISPVAVSNSNIRLDVTFAWSNQQQTGILTSAAQINVCYDSTCQRHLAGSPIDLTLSYTITNDPLPEPGLTPLPVISRTSLAHDVIDAEYSASLEAIVMVSSYPNNAVYVYDTTTGQENRIGLVSVPTSVSVSPDGMQAAVGHDARVSLVDLSTAGNPSAPAPILLSLTTEAFDTVLDGRGYVHVMPRTDQWVGVHSVEIATNTETVASGSIYAGTRARLHPSGNYIYGADNGLSPSDIEKYDIRNGPATYLYDSPYHGDYGMCGNLWFKENGTTIYTACGNTFRASATKEQDMLYSGRLQLSTSQYYAYVIRSLSQSDETNDLALIEYDTYNCASWNSQAQCYTRFAIYESEFLQRQNVYAIPPVAVTGTSYSQHGLFVFHSSDGSHRYMISRLFGMPNPDAEYYFTVQQ